MPSPLGNRSSVSHRRRLLLASLLLAPALAAPALARASMMTVFLATSIAGVGAALVLGLATRRELWLAMLLFPAVLLGNWLGHEAFGRVGDAAWRVFTGAVLGVSALAAVWRLLKG